MFHFDTEEFFDLNLKLNLILHLLVFAFFFIFPLFTIEFGLRTKQEFGKFLRLLAPEIKDIVLMFSSLMKVIHILRNSDLQERVSMVLFTLASLTKIKIIQYGTFVANACNGIHPTAITFHIFVNDLLLLLFSGKEGGVSFLGFFVLDFGFKGFLFLFERSDHFYDIG